MNINGGNHKQNTVTSWKSKLKNKITIHKASTESFIVYQYKHMENSQLV